MGKATKLQCEAIKFLTRKSRLDYVQVEREHLDGILSMYKNIISNCDFTSDTIHTRLSQGIEGYRSFSIKVRLNPQETKRYKIRYKYTLNGFLEIITHCWLSDQWDVV